MLLYVWMSKRKALVHSNNCVHHRRHVDGWILQVAEAGSCEKAMVFRFLRNQPVEAFI